MERPIGVSKVGWLIEMLVDKFFNPKLHEWVSKEGLEEEYSSLKSRLSEVQMVLGAARTGKRIENKYLVESLSHLQYVTYTAEDLLDELDYYRLKEEIEGTNHYNDSSNQVSDLVASSSAPQLMSDAVLFREVIGQKNQEILSSKRELDEEDLVPCSVKRTKLDREETSRRITEIIKQLREIGDNVRKALKLEKLDAIVRTIESTSANPRETTSYVTEPKVIGRDKERDQILELLMSEKFSNTNLSVVPIVGHGGVGKTTLAQIVYNDTEVANYFDMKIWICVSTNFDKIKLTREIFDYSHHTLREKHEGMTNFNNLQAKLAEFSKNKRILVVVDDIWEDEKKSEWEKLLAPLRCGEKKGSVILATTRKLSVAKMISTTDPITLDGLEKDDFWNFFKLCAFDDENYEGCQDLQEIGRAIVERLRGYPLAAKTVGALLKQNLRRKHWESVLESDEWKFQVGDDDIVPALKLSYDHLPSHLQQCFSYCSLFPKDNEFERKDLVNIWIAQGFIISRNINQTWEEIGNEYLNDLVNLSFFERFGSGTHCFKIHDLLHDLAQRVSFSECLSIDGSEIRQIPQTILHISIYINDPDSDDVLEPSSSNLPPDDRILKMLAKVKDHVNVENLHTLIFYGDYDESFVCTFRGLFSKAKRLRVLSLMITRSTHIDMNHPLCNFSNLIHLRYLQVQGISSVPTFFDWWFLCRFYHLQTLEIEDITSGFPRDMSNLVNLRHCLLHQWWEELSDCGIYMVGNLTSLQELPIFSFKKDRGFEMAQLGNLRELKGSLKINFLQNVETKEEASSAKLETKKLTDLELCWECDEPCIATAADVLEGLKPNSNLKFLRIERYNGVVSPTWLSSNISLVLLESLELEGCPKWEILPPIGDLPFLKNLFIRKMESIREISSQFYGTGPKMGFQSLEDMYIDDMPELEKWASIDECRLFPCLKTLSINKCPKLMESPLSHSVFFVEENLNWFPLLHKLTITHCPHLFTSAPQKLNKQCFLPLEKLRIDTTAFLTVPSCMRLKFLRWLTIKGCTDCCKAEQVVDLTEEQEKALPLLTSLQELHFYDWPNLKSLPAGLHLLPSLKKLFVLRCPLIRSLPEKGLPTSLESLTVWDCNKDLDEQCQEVIKIRNLKPYY